ncbi:MAG: ABC transporter ATP-binding protein [Acidimicrobiales bacterium]|jgi:ATP-binding cassette subfamily B protein|nr:ABC transporter ATP-binding protein [Acidimicrobiales bacterium]MDP6648588.1 ABC transporter ATP-binding protein [Acidimicrobiales bacterium]MDP6760082.1 ABC transporter ATP-binding protein [Acidimicrobiales bacterium]
MGLGHPGGRFTIGPSSMQANADAGLPFADVPGDLAGRVEAVLEHEPEHPDPIVDFSHSHWDRRPFGLRTFLRPHAGGLALAVLLVVVETALLHLGPLLVQRGIDRGVLAKDTGVLVTVALVFVGSVVLAALATALRTAFTGRIGERLVYELRVRVFSHFQRQSLGFFTAERSGVLMTRMTSDIEALTVLFQEGLIQFVVQGMTLVVVTAYLLILNPTLALVCLAVVAPVNVLLTLWFRKVSAVGYLRIRDRIADVLADLSESLDGIRLITAFNRRRHNTVRHHNIVGAHFDANLATSRAQALYGPGTEAFGIVSQAVILLVGGRMVLRNDLSLGEMVAFLLFLTSFFAPIQTLVQLFNQYQQGSAAITKLRGVLGTQPAVPERSDAHDLPPVEGQLVLDSVTFGYDPDHLVLREVDLEVAPGEVLAVVGPTGAGKSTVAKLVTRFYDPDFGHVRLDGNDLRDVTLESLRTQVGVVPQEPFLFNGSIRQNVAFARPDADEAEVRAACTAVGLDRLLDRLPAGIDSPVHERGASLSAGERQLLALARVFLAKPRMLVLDEATSNLDLLSEGVIERALDTVLEGRTAVIIAHRLATVLRADRIAVVDGGRIAEIGTHAELVALGGQYAAMNETWVAQTTGEATP